MSLKKYCTLVVGTLLLGACNSSEKSENNSPVTFEVTSPSVKTITLQEDFVGQVYGKRDIAIRARVDGLLEQIHFQEGAYVQKGDLLYSIEDETYQSSLSAAQSKLAQARAAYVQAKSDLARIKPLAKINAVSQRELDAAINTEAATKAGLDAAQSGVELQKIRLNYSQVKAPTSGIIGQTEARLGEYVGRNPNPVILNTISLIDSVRVEFFITESDYLQIARYLKSQSKKENSDTAKKEALPLQLILADGSIFEHRGKIDFINRQVDASTGAMLLQGTFPNPNELLRPGQFAKVRVATNTIQNALLVPQRAVKELQGRYFVMAVADSNTLEQRSIEIINVYKDYYVLKQGLSHKDRFVIQGLQKAKEGIVIQPREQPFQSQFP